jgi:hypothetical protein
VNNLHSDVMTLLTLFVRLLANWQHTMPQTFQFLLLVNAAILAAFAQHFTNAIIPTPTDGTAEAGQPLQTVSAHPDFYYKSSKD